MRGQHPANSQMKDQVTGYPLTTGNGEPTQLLNEELKTMAIGYNGSRVPGFAATRLGKSATGGYLSKLDQGAQTL